MPEDSDDDALYTTGDIGRLAGMSYRQLSDWDSKGVLPGSTGPKSSWRRYTPREVFVILVLSKLRKQFGVPVDRLGFVREFMLSEGANHFSAAVDLMSLLGVEVWLMTDFEDTFVMDSELEFADMWQHGYFGGPLDFAAFLKVSPIVNLMLSRLDPPMHLPSHGRGHEIMNEVRKRFGASSPAEFEVLQAIRSGDYDSVEVVLRDGSIDRIKATATPSTESDLIQLIESHDYQTISITKRDGHIVSIKQQPSFRP